MGWYDQAGWREERRSASLVRADLEERRRAAESQRARAMIADFLVEVCRRGIRARPLRARSYGGVATYRTPLRGWYLVKGLPVAIATDGQFYELIVPPSTKALVSGVRPEPSDPPLDLARGGRDGEATSLEAVLKARLEAGDDWE